MYLHGSSAGGRDRRTRTMSHLTTHKHCQSSYLPAYKAAVIYVPIRLYTCREPSTNQLLFMQNKPNFQKAQMNVNPYNTTDYENKWPRRVRKNKPNSNPIKANFKRAKMNINSLITRDYRKKDDFDVRKNKPNSNPISEKPKMNVNLYIIKDYEYFLPLAGQKNKPKQSQFRMGQIPYFLK